MGVPVSRYDEEEFIPWYREETPGWIELSMAERGALISIAMKLNRKTGTLTLRRGIESLALLLRCDWAELGPLVGRLIAAGKLSWDGTKYMLFDPEHECRRRKTSTERVREFRARSKSDPPHDETPRNVGNVSSVTGGCVTPLSSPLLSSDLSSGESAERGPPEPPKWWDAACETVAMQTGEAIEKRPAWLRYWGHRSSTGKRVAQPDAVYWLTTVDAKEARKERRDEAQRRNRAGPAPPHEPRKLTAEERRREAETFAALMAGSKKPPTRSGTDG